METFQTPVLPIQPGYFYQKIMIQQKEAVKAEVRVEAVLSAVFK